MLHRRNLHDDALGVFEPLNEPGSDNRGLIVKGSLFIVFSTVETSAMVHRELAHLVNYQPLILVQPDSDSNSQSKRLQKLLDKRSLLGPINLPPNLHLLTFMKDFDYEIPNSYIIRIEHFYEIGEDSELSRPVTLDLSVDLGLDVVGVKEMSLGANMEAEELDERLKWNTLPDLHFSKLDFQNFEKKSKSVIKDIENFQFTFEPVQIRTFRVWIS